MYENAVNAGSGIAGYANDSSLKAQAYQSQIGSQTVPIAPPPKQMTVAETVLSRLQTIQQLLLETLERKQLLLERLHGPRPCDPEAQNKALQQPGVLGLIDEKLGYVESIARKILDAQITIDRIA